MKDQSENKSSSSQFLKTDGGKTKSNSIEVPSISLPKGGGAIKGIDEKFSVNAVNGTASFSVPLPFSPARGASPSLSLSYNSGGGNGIFGLGWNIGLASIKRKTDKGLPQYFDAIDSDTYLFSEAEDLVPEFKKVNGQFIQLNGEYVIYEKDHPATPNDTHTIRFYKPRIEGLFARIERWTEKATGIISWRVITKENVTTLFGWPGSSVLTDPKDNKKIFEWLPEFVFDDKGNCAQYIYKKEDDKGFDASLLHNRNRLAGGNITYTNLYLEKVLYGNKTPYKKFDDACPAETDFMFQTVFDYGEYDTNAPYAKINDWDFRTNAFSDYKAGFEIRTTRLCKRVLLFHYFNELPGGFALIKSTNFEYDTTAPQDFTFLKSITAFGYIKKADETYTSKKLPATEFEYQKHEWNIEVKTISTENLIHAPSGLDEQQYQFSDLFNEGLSGILTEQANGWYYKHNLGEGIFEQAKLVTPKPSFAGLGNHLQLVDLDADGTKQIANFNSEPKGYFELNDDNEWLPFRNFEQLPNIDLGDANTRMIDLNGDGMPDVLISEENVFTWYESDGRKGFSETHKTIKPFDEEAGPAIVFADAKQTIFLADMSGDGLSDIVRIRNGEVCYWPNLGYGKFGTKVAMDNAPLFDHNDLFNPAYLRIADIDGSGTPDLIYLGKNKYSCWMNLSGNSYAVQPFEIKTFPEIHSQSKISVTDLLGNGVACLVWSSALGKDAQAPLKYIDLMNSKKPHIMVNYRNNLGKEVSMEYMPSTKFYIEDKLAGKPWITKLHFPVHCVAKTTVEDKITGHRFTTSYKYHHGYYDHFEREFRGFGMVEQFDSEQTEHWGETNGILLDETLNQKTVFTKSWVHTGAYLRNDKILTQFAHEYWYEEMDKQGFAVVNNEYTLPDARIVDINGTTINSLSIDETREAFRACKSMALHSEVFALDAPLTGATDPQKKAQLTPYTVATHNCIIELLQPKGKNKHAVFVVKESESISYNYERNTNDPRIAHNLNIKLDEYGNVIESAAIVYQRVSADISLPQETQDAQAKTTIIYTKNSYTNDVFNNATDDVLGENTYRLRLPSEILTFELKDVAKTNLFYYSVNDFTNILAANEVTHPNLKFIPVTGSVQRRLIEHIRTNYLLNDLSGPLPIGQLESLALPYESYQLAYTPELLEDIFGPINAPRSKIDDALMLEGKFTHSESDSNWWIRSGTTQFITGLETALDAQNRFYVPVSYTDPYGAKTKVKYYSNYFLFMEETEDAAGNKSKVDIFNFRTLAPQRMRDMNNNLSESIVDELGLVKAMAVFGKGNEADDLTGLTEFTNATETALINSFFNAPDSVALTAIGKNLLQHATARFVYDFDVYQTTGKPAVVASIVREEHFLKNNASQVQLSFEYSGGLGKVVMKKVQAEPGIAKQVTLSTVNAVTVVTVVDIDTSLQSPKQLRWIGNGRTILNNKGNPVKQYEPYFSTTHQYEDQKELVEMGVTPIMYYDAVGRLIKTEMPDGTFSKVEFTSWKQLVYDANDTVTDSDWYKRRTDQSRLDYITDTNEQTAALKASAHYNTPSQLHFDTLGRPVLQVENNGKDIQLNDILYKTKIELDVEGNLRKVTDARANVVMEYKYDMLGNLVYQKSMDAGQRWLLHNIAGNPLRTWDERNHEFQYFYDVLHRPLESKVLGGDGATPLNNIFDKIIYGEGISLLGKTDIDLNLRGKVYRHYDTGGLVETPEYDFAGQPLSTTRNLFKDYKSVANWTVTNLINDLETDAFTFITKTDALGRITKQTAPDGSIITPAYNEAGLLNGESVLHTGSTLPATYIKDIDYNEKGQRNKIIYGNDVTTKFYYDKETFRLTRLETKRLNNDPLQDWFYTYDPIGNIIHIEDKIAPVVFYSNSAISALCTYSYDALYRLVEASGRENNAALTINNQDNWNDAAYMQQMNPGDLMAVHNYTQKYQYDAVGNILQMKHLATGNNWTRDYAYETINNRLKTTQIGTQIYNYPHHTQHGFINVMPHLEELGWNFKEELVKTIRQKRTDGGIPETTFYQYDGQGQRIRKITENTANPGNTPTKKEERIYIAGYELYKKHSGSFAGLERTSLSLLDEGHRFVMVETRNNINDGTQQHLVRYQLHNHLGSASLELDDTANVISYEEYHPFGTTAYQAQNATIKAIAKRYRYTGMERDEESGLEYHSARYYLPSLGRWLSTDPIGIGDGVNIYKYADNNPLIFFDRNGTDIILYTQDGKYWGKYQIGSKGEPMKINPNSPKYIQETIKAINAIYLIEDKDGGPSPKEVIEYLVNTHSIKLDISSVALKKGKNYAVDVNKLSDIRFRAPTINRLDKTKSSFGAISWTPFIGAQITKNGKLTGEKTSPATILAHELKHAYNYFNLSIENYLKLKKADSQFGNADDRDAITTMEWIVAKRLGDGLRYSHGDVAGFETNQSVLKHEKIVPTDKKEDNSNNDKEKNSNEEKAVESVEPKPEKIYIKKRID